MPNITTNHAITYTNTLYFLDILSILRSASVPDLRFVLDFAICS